MNLKLMIQITRVVLYGLVVLLTVMNYLIQDNFYNWSLIRSFYGFSIVGLLFHFVVLLKLESFYQRRVWVFLSFILDLILISALMIGSGLNQTLFLFLFLMNIVLSGLVFQFRGAMLIAGMTSIAFTVCSWFGPEIKAMSFLFMLILNNIAFFVMAGVSGFLSEQMSLFQEKIEAQNLSLGLIRRLNEMIVDTIPAGLLTMNQESEILQANPGALLVFASDSLQGKKIFEILPELKSQVDFKSITQTGKIFEVKHQVSGDDKLLQIRILPQTTDFSVPIFLVVIDDLTESRRLEFQVLQAEKMAAVGQLAAGIAHEIRNPLAGISGSVEMLSQQFSSEDDKKLGKIILREIDRLNRLISEFLDFAKPEKPPVDVVSVSEVLKEVIESAKAAQTKDVEVLLSLSPQAKILGQKDKLKQAFLNIVINSYQAMQEIPAARLSIACDVSEGSVVAKISDNGIGMNPETKKRMFEAFHTTKPKGTGLGLAVTHKILQAHQAQISIESEPGQGTQFVVSFPLKNS
jgi:two-component system sensor histidine kinase PilS (NtrC family)